MAATPLLGLSLPADGTTNWGTLVNTSITALLDSAVAGTTTLSSDADVTLSATTEAANQARQAIILWNATGTVTRNITAPAQSKTYVVINATGGTQSIVFRGTGPTTGVTIPAGKAYMLAWKGNDFVAIGVTTVNLATDVSGTLPIANGGTNSTTAPTAGGVAYGTGTAYAVTTAGTSGQVLTSNGASAPTWATPSANVSSISFGTTGLTPATATSGVVTVGGTLEVANGGTGLNSFIQYSVFYAGTSNVIAQSSNFQFNGTTLTLANDALVSGITVGKGGGSVSTNTAVGNSALFNNSSGANQTSIGSSSMYNMRGSNNTAFGYQSMYAGGTPSTNTGTSNVALGAETLYSVTSGSFNTAVGRSALKNSTSSSSQTAVGYQALFNNRGNNNVAVGVSSMAGGTPSSSTGVNNTAVGSSSLTALTSGNYNVSLGYQTGLGVTTGEYNIFIGTNVTAGAASGNGQIVIGRDISGSDARISIGSSSGQIYNDYTVSATWTQTSDISLKNIIGPDALGLSFINRLRPIKFTWKPLNELSTGHPYYKETNDRDTSTVVHGFIAQDVKDALKEEGCSTFNGWVQGPDGIQAISREMFVSPLVNAVNELTDLVKKLNERIEALEAK